MVDTKLVVDPAEAERVRQIFQLYDEQEGLIPVVQELNRRDWRTQRWTTHKGTQRGGRPFDKNALYDLLRNVTYVGKVKYKDEVHDGEHERSWTPVSGKVSRPCSSGTAAQAGRS